MRRLSKNFLSIIGSDIVRRLMGFFTVAYLARKVGSANFGVITLGFTALSYALTISSSGLVTFGIRSVARGESVGIVNRIISYRLAGSLGAFLLVCLVAAFLVPDPLTAKITVIMCLSLFANAFLIDWYFQGREEMGMVGTGRMASALVYLILIVLFVNSAEDILWVAIGAVAGDVVSALMLLAFYNARVNPLKLRFSTHGWRSSLAQAVPMGAGTMLANLSINLPPLVLGFIMTKSDVGIYGAASKLVFFLLMLDRVMATLLLPASARIHTQSRELLSATLSTALKWIIVTALPVCVGGAILADGLLPVVFGPQYLQAVEVFRILIWYFLITMLHTVYTTGLIAAGQERAYGAIMGVSAAIYFVSVIVCARLYGTPGAAAAVVVSEFATLVITRQRFQRYSRLQMPPSLIKIVIACIVMAGVLFLARPLNTAARVIAGFVAYAALLLGTKALTSDEISGLLKRI